MPESECEEIQIYHNVAKARRPMPVQARNFFND
jgi:hypothetical protein